MLGWVQHCCPTLHVCTHVSFSTCPFCAAALAAEEDERREREALAASEGLDSLAPPPGTSSSSGQVHVPAPYGPVEYGAAPHIARLEMAGMRPSSGASQSSDPAIKVLSPAVSAGRVVLDT